MTAPGDTRIASLPEQMQRYRQRHSEFLTQQLDQRIAVASNLNEAMRYAVLLGGKRVRPCLVYATGELLGASQGDLDAPAAAIECVHAYSLVHDDLPAMDDDALRRGQPTCHIAFDEATAILAGDALQALAFELISQHHYHHVSAQQQVSLIATLAKAAGDQGMCAGQALDLAATGLNVELPALEQIHQFKTGALIQAAVELGIGCAPAVTTNVRQQLIQWSQHIGLAFQVQDDILDVIGDTKSLGKQQGSDELQGKSTYPSLMTLSGAQTYLRELHEKALHALHAIPYNTRLLEEFTDYLITRDR